MKTFYFCFQSFIFLCHDQISNEIKLYIQSSVQFSRSVMSNSLRTHGLQHSRLPCPSQHLELYIPRSNPQRTKSTKINNIKDVLKRELPIQSNRRNSKEWLIPLYEIVFPLLDQHIFFCSTFFFFSNESHHLPRSIIIEIYILCEKNE